MSKTTRAEAQKQFEEAQAYYDRALAAYNRDPEEGENHGWLQEAQHSLVQASAELEAMMESTPENIPEKKDVTEWLHKNGITVKPYGEKYNKTLSNYELELEYGYAFIGPNGDPIGQIEHAVQLDEAGDPYEHIRVINAKTAYREALDGIQDMLFKEQPIFNKEATQTLMVSLPRNLEAALLYRRLKFPDPTTLRETEIVAKYTDATSGALTVGAELQFGSERALIQLSRHLKQTHIKQKEIGDINHEELARFLRSHTEVALRLDQDTYATFRNRYGHLRDTRKGGLTRTAYEMFKDNALVLDAARADREKKLKQASSGMRSPHSR